MESLSTVEAGDVYGPYRVVRPLGAGGMGTVLLAEDPRLRRFVALKTCAGHSASQEAREHVLREARAAAQLSHPNIAAVHDVLDLDGQLIIVFEFVEGETLAERLRRGRLPV
ncbi:MAG TPA: protein kinase, partial [Vicinamibacterales bacterium]|nr:protein kinase [Vicinamibacterales bacterium]